MLSLQRITGALNVILINTQKHVSYKWGIYHLAKAFKVSSNSGHATLCPRFIQQSECPFDTMPFENIRIHVSTNGFYTFQKSLCALAKGIISNK